MNTFTKQEIHQAIYRAAARIERDPKSLNHCGSWDSDLRKGTAGCLLVHVGVQLGMEFFGASDVVETLAMPCALPAVNNNQLLNFVKARTGEQYIDVVNNGALAAPHLRAYADKFYGESRALVPLGNWSDVHALIGWRPREVA